MDSIQQKVNAEMVGQYDHMIEFLSVSLRSGLTLEQCINSLKVMRNSYIKPSVDLGECSHCGSPIEPIWAKRYNACWECNELLTVANVF